MMIDAGNKSTDLYFLENIPCANIFFCQMHVNPSEDNLPKVEPGKYASHSLSLSLMLIYIHYYITLCYQFQRPCCCCCCFVVVVVLLLFFVVVFWCSFVCVCVFTNVSMSLPKKKQKKKLRQAKMG